MNRILQILHDKKQLKNIDIQFAQNIAEVFDAHEHELFFALLFHTVSSAHTCLRRDKLDILPFYKDFKPEIDDAFSDISVNSLTYMGVVAKAPAVNAPFISDENRLYLKAFYLHEKAVSDYISSAAVKRHSYPVESLKQLITKYFGTDANYQKAAALNACLNSFSVISGGPGTGKTTTVFKVLAILNELHENSLSIAVCAPTGKAAARLTESIAKASEQFADENLNIPAKAVTLHRMLKMTGNSERCGYNTDSPMPYDVVVADEASMIDLRMMSLLIQALKPDSRLILLGDKDQLASVQPGSVLGDICALSPVDSFSPETSALMNTCADIQVSQSENFYADITVQLKTSHRFDGEKGIGLLAKSCRDADADASLNVLRNDPSGQIKFIESGDTSLLKPYIEEHYKKIVSSPDPAEALKAVSSFVVLTPLSGSGYGTEGINTLALNHLYFKGLRDNTKQHFSGLPVMITENDYNLNLHNGTTGVIFNSDGLKAWFEEESRVRPVSVLRLPPWTAAFAMTVHKSQGSEFDHVLLYLPDSDSPVMTSELFYTAVTRAKSKLTVISAEKTIRNCLARRTERYSGLFR